MASGEPTERPTPPTALATCIDGAARRVPDAGRVRTMVRSLARRVAAQVPAPVRDALRPAARRVGLAAAPGDWTAQTNPLWAPPGRVPDVRWCNICRWSGPAFLGDAHTESAGCPQCGSIARDRFLLWCFTSNTPGLGGQRVIETSPRLGEPYRAYMRRWFSYRTSDFDLSAHTGDIQLDLQDIALPDASVDVVLTPHVLEHVPDTDRAIAELHRVIAPGGRMFLQIPLVQGTTAPPVEPEFHGDNTPVFWRFGWDLTDRLRAGGFETDVLVTAGFARMLNGDAPAPDTTGSEFDLPSMLESVRPADLRVAATDDEADLMGFLPAYQFATWECRRT